MKSPKTESPYKRHLLAWKNCQRCPLAQKRNRVVFARGRLPCDVLFVGEAPGDSEDVLGQPFVGPAGRLLDYIITVGLDGQYDCAMTNLVCCIPKDETNMKGEPPKDCVKTCLPRLEEFIAIADPKVIVCVGLLSKKYTPAGSIPSITVIHPAAILRMDISQQSLAIKRCVVALEDLAAEYLEEN
jgi:uracil-DNA glycosylase